MKTLMAVVMVAVKAAAIGALACASAFAQDRAALERTPIIGNRELPKVLVIVPWKKPLPGELLGRPVQSVLDETLAPIDRDVLRRQVGYYSQLSAKDTGTPEKAPTVMPPVAPR
jgi:hypothetical protein